MRVPLFSVVVTAILGIGVCGCSGWLTKPTEQLVTPGSKKPPKIAPVVKMEAPRQPGSLWSEGSRWNEIFSVALSRKVGDTIFVRPTDDFKTALNGKGAKLNVSAPESGKEERGYSSVIREVLPRGVYRIFSTQHIKTDTVDQTVSFAGRVRERDINEDDSVSADMLFDLAADVTHHPIPQKLGQDEKKKG